jgi:OmpA-OmpF porin, OOP family
MRWWILTAIMTSSVLHVGLLYALGDMRLAGLPAAAEAAKGDDIRFEDRIQLDPKMLEQTLSSAPQLSDPNAVETDMTSELPPLSQLAEHLRGDVIFSPETKQVVNINLSTAAMGQPGSNVEAISAVDTAMAGGIDTQIRSSASADILKTAQAQQDQVTIRVDDAPLAGTAALKAELSAARKKGNEGLRGMGFSTLDDLLNIKTPVTGDLKAMMPSDLLFDYNSADFKESAKADLMNLGYLIQTWTKSQIIIEGHTDTTGDDEYNMQLSLARAQSVKTWITNSLKLPGDRIQVKGYGKTQPLAGITGDKDAQALNRRVVIRFVNP